MDSETAQRIEKLEYAVRVLCNHVGLDAAALLNGQATFSSISDAVPPSYPAAAQPGMPALPEEFYALVRKGKKIQAIKMLRELTNLGLKEAKDFVDRIS